MVLALFGLFRDCLGGLFGRVYGSRMTVTTFAEWDFCG